MKLKIDVKDLSSCEKVLTIDLPPETVTEEFETFYTTVGKRAKIPGFRPGHAPKHVVALHFKEEAKNVKNQMPVFWYPCAFLPMGK